ncbi:pseudouridine synthase [Lampropedia cohaerens]|uniref:Pseudouridine synthase n=1 Tax=Lampropedia cohaerens TaxID=1610491 RepID=A0A0U1Q0X5_9BURK|nr:16S rRNA pseudouridine(516) synthase [Lampropedia cohaerens]KKW68424.1 pseudouridine synthase [Lampropedia cohaerens]
MQLADILFSQGFGTRRVCFGLVQAGLVDWRKGQGDWQRAEDALQELDTSEAGGALMLRVQGEVWPYKAKAYLMLHKPVATECSARPSAYPSIYTLLPAPLRQRPVKGGKPGVQAIGRLDQDTTGLLLLSDDGAFIHRMSAPRHQVPKVYEVRAKHPVTARQIQQLLQGVVLHDSHATVRADACTQHSPTHLSLTLHAGKYHQVKRMVAAVGNRVEALHRSRIGQLELPQTLAPGQWRWLSGGDLQALGWSPQAAA